MKLTTFAIASTLLAAGGLAAHAQGTGTSPATPGASATQCWDSATNMVRNQAPGSTASNLNNSPSTSAGGAANPSAGSSATTGSAGSASGSSGMSKSSPTPGGSASATRPSGLRDC